MLTLKDKAQEEGYEPADSPFMKEGTDTAGYATKPEDLCDECKTYGFCKRGNPERFEAKRKAKEACEAIKSVLPETEDITIEGKDYKINYKQFILPEDFAPEGYSYKDGRAVDDTDERQLVINEIERRIYEAYTTTKEHDNG